MPTRQEKSRPGQPLCACSGTGVFVGYASLFGIADQSNDMVMRGAFINSLKRRPPADVRMLFQHDAAEPIGTWVDILETERGLLVRGRLDPRVQRAREINALLESGGLDGLSIGFKTQAALRDKTSGIRKLLQLDLWEISGIGMGGYIGGRSLEKIAGQLLQHKQR